MLDLRLKYHLRFGIAALLLAGGSLIFTGFSMPSVGMADSDLMVLDNGDDSVLTGIIKDVDYGSFVLDVSGKDIRVDMDDVDLDGDLDDYLKEGMRVTVEGTLDEDEIEATRVIRGNDDPSRLVLDHDVLTGDGIELQD